MSAERLAAAFHAPAAPAHPATDCATVNDMLAADPHLAPDIEDGAALRRLREALPAGWYLTVAGPHPEWNVNVFAPVRPEVVNVSRLDRHGPTLAQAADAAREALERGR